MCVLVTGISGAGKSQAIKCLEDFGFFCVDNLPAPLIPKFADLMVTSGDSMRKVALGIDVREGRFFKGLSRVLGEFRSRNISALILFFDANDATLLRRYSETRRKHPLGKGVLEGIRKERKRLAEFRAKADRVIETSQLTLSDLKEMVASSLPTALDRTLHTTIYSFGYKYGLPPDADLVWDVRFLPNPNYVPSLHSKTGLSKAVRRYVLIRPDSKRFLPKFFSLVLQCLPQYIREGKSHFTIAIGCTGGKHRSVTIAMELARFLKKRGYPVSIHHRDMDHSGL
ncbi:MAG: RNase adaptor protein RapZ [Elusimicrobia bacterium RIFCSPLOWO2_01_FULL_64_13]|nr:MAG: RNase adaptor protein RapZ [Elusimicrobia bacterium RIFCSPHIGHO2_01_FULL_64_10]OGR97277.1 MAG: RNase adaptor protein RapZ [Elusimicrobia bacterium RIFCSPLOWO2_01_FULL_64_13]